MNQQRNHTKISYKVIEDYSDLTLKQIIEVYGIVYELNYSPRPCSTISELYAVYYKGVRYPTLAKFLKS